MAVYVLVYTTDKNVNVKVYSDYKKPREIIRLKKEKLKRDKRYEIIESTANLLVYKDLELDIIIKYLIKSTEVIGGN